MKIIQQPLELEPAVQMECACGCQFWVDPIGEENLVFVPEEGHLVEVCPQCKKVNYRNQER